MAGDIESTYGEVVEPVGFHCGVGRGVLVVDVGVAGIAVGDVVVLVSSRGIYRMIIIVTQVGGCI